MFDYIRAKWDSWRINRWLRLRRNGVEQRTSLRRSFLTPTFTKNILERCLNNALASTGLFTFKYNKGGKFSPDADWTNQVQLVSWALADLSSALSLKEQESIKHFFKELSTHNWGVVRDAAIDALQHMNSLDEDKQLVVIT